MYTKVLILTLLLASPLWAQVDVESVPAPETNPVSLNINSYGGLQFTNKIKIPKGRRGLQPDLALSYMSGQQNGVAGLNWSLPVLSVDLKDGYQTRYFVGGTELVWDSSSNAYSKKLSDFSTYVFDGASWTCVTREGLVMVFGGTADSRLSNPAGKVARWFVSRVTDSNGNYISYEYQNYGQPLIKTIRYTGHPNLAPYYAIHFHYENRPDAVQSVETGFLTVLSVRLKTIQVVAGTQNVRAYSLKYTQSPYTKRSLLQSVTEFGSDVKVATNGNCTGSSLPAVIYSYRDQKQNLVNHIKSTGGLPGHDFKSARDTLFAYTDRSGVGMAAATRRDSGWVTIYKGNEAGLTPVLISRQGIAGYSFLGEMDVLAHVPGAVHDYFIAFRLGEDRFWLIRHNPDGSYTATHQSETGIGSFSPGQKHKIATFLDREGSHIIFWGEKSYAHIMIDEESEQLELIDRSSSVAGITPSENHVLSAVDLDSDGFTDLLAVNTKTNKTVVMLSHGGGAYESVPFSAGTFKGVLFNKLLGVGHFNQDNRPDVLLHDGGTSYYVASLVDRRLAAAARAALSRAGFSRCHAPGAAPLVELAVNIGGKVAARPPFFDLRDRRSLSL
jgi:hypothetical protein